MLSKCNLVDHVDWFVCKGCVHHNDVIMSTMASQITSLGIVYSTFYSGADQRKHQRSASLTSVWWIHRWPINSPHKRPVTRKHFPFDDVNMEWHCPAKNSTQKRLGRWIVSSAPKLLSGLWVTRYDITYWLQFHVRIDKNTHHNKVVIWEFRICETLLQTDEIVSDQKCYSSAEEQISG